MFIQGQDMTILEKWKSKGVLDEIEDEKTQAIVAFMLEAREKTRINYTQLASDIFGVQQLPSQTGLVYYYNQREEKDYFMEGMNG